MKIEEEIRLIRDMKHMNNLFNSNIGFVFGSLFFLFIVSIFLAIVLIG